MTEQIYDEIFDLESELKNLSDEDWNNNVLDCDMFDGDFSASDDRCLINKIVIARKSKTPCHFCGYLTVQKTKIRVATYVFGGVIMNYRWCNACCNHMAVDDVDGLEDRFQLINKG